MKNYYPGMEFENPYKGTAAPSDSHTSKDSGGAAMPVTKIDDFDEFQDIISREENVLVKFEADWCMPCKAMASVVEEVARMHPNVKVLAVNIEGDGIDAVLQKYEVRSVPTFVHLRGGTKVRATAGTISKAELNSFISE